MCLHTHKPIRLHDTVHRLNFTLPFDTHITNRAGYMTNVLFTITWCLLKYNKLHYLKNCLELSKNEVLCHAFLPYSAVFFPLRDVYFIAFFVIEILGNRELYYN
jgi:hypothetical protein